MSESRQVLIAAAFCGFGWLSAQTYAFQIIGPYLHPCTDGNDLPYLVSLVAGPATLAMSALLLTIAAGFGVLIRWPCLLFLGTVAAALYILPGTLVETTLGGRFICSSNAAGGPVDHPVTTWHRAYVPVHNAAIVLFGGFLVWLWRRPGAPDAAREPRDPGLREESGDRGAPA